jgi:hypothetical protein
MMFGNVGVRSFSAIELHSELAVVAQWSPVQQSEKVAIAGSLLLDPVITLRSTIKTRLTIKN